jgi:hypothetical protein
VLHRHPGAATMAQHTHHIGMDLEPEEAIHQLRLRRNLKLAAVVSAMIVALVIAFLAVYAMYSSGPNAGMY